MNKLKESDKLILLDQLEYHNLFFRTLWEVSEIYLCETTTETALVTIDDDHIRFVFNPVFWNKHSLKFKLFVICHEQLHLMLDHINRLAFNTGNIQLKNIAADISVNHMLIRNYDFDRDVDIPDWRNFCWVDTVFIDKPNIPTNETAEYYYAQLISNNISCDQSTIDDHGKFDPITNKAVTQAIDTASSQWVNQPPSNIPLEYWKEQIQSHIQNKVVQIVDIQPKKQSWKAVYNRIIKSIFEQKQIDCWYSTDRRYTLLPNDLMLPSVREIDVYSKVKVHIYLDTSGSCVEDAKYFLNSSFTFDKDLFEIKRFGFDVNVYDIPNKPPYKLKGFGGTSFNCIQKHVNSCTQVDAVFVFTDGDADLITPINPIKWFWMILPNGTKSNIYSKCNIIDLAKYNWKK